MAPNRVEYRTIDVFTTTPFSGNPLSIVHVPNSLSSPPLTQSQKQLIAREFNLSETVFLHPSELSGNGTSSGNVDNGDIKVKVAIDIFSTETELPFGGHPSIGAAWYLLTRVHPHLNDITLFTKAGEIPVTRETNPTNANPSVRIRIPIDFTPHPSLVLPDLKSTSSQPFLTPADYVNGPDGPEAIVSIVKGMSFILLALASPDALARMQPYAHVPGLLGAWGGFVGVYAFVRSGTVVRTRMFYGGGLEDAASGSAAAALGGWFAVSGHEAGVRGEGEYRVDILQAVEMGRPSEITVIVSTVEGKEGGGERVVSGVQLEGSAVEVMHGSICIPGS